jgi:hypothetical protein
MKAWKTPMNLRLREIEIWRESGFKRAIHDPDIAKNDPDRSKASRAAQLYEAAAARANGAAISDITSFH